MTTTTDHESILQRLPPHVRKRAEREAMIAAQAAWPTIDGGPAQLDDPGANALAERAHAAVIADYAAAAGDAEQAAKAARDETMAHLASREWERPPTVEAASAMADGADGRARAAFWSSWLAKRDEAPLMSWEVEERGWVRRWTRGTKRGEVALLVRYDEDKGQWTGNGLRFFGSADEAKSAVDADPTVAALLPRFEPSGLPLASGTSITGPLVLRSMTIVDDNGARMALDALVRYLAGHVVALPVDLARRAMNLLAATLPADPAADAEVDAHARAAAVRYAEAGGEGADLVDEARAWEAVVRPYVAPRTPLDRLRLVAHLLAPFGGVGPSVSLGTGDDADDSARAIVAALPGAETWSQPRSASETPQRLDCAEVQIAGVRFNARTVRTAKGAAS